MASHKSRSVHNESSCSYDQQALTSLLGDEAGAASREYAQSICFATYSGTSDLVDQMRKGFRLDTRLFLRPIYKLCKHMTISTDYNNPTVPRTSQCWIPFQTPLVRNAPSVEAQQAGVMWRQHVNFVASLAIAEWLVMLSTHGDETLGINIQAHLQPAYAYNTIITMAQRASAALEARATYGRMCFHKLCPDVFTVTALIDVFGRAHECNGAFWLFKLMHSNHGLSPNVVTCVTAARVSIVHRDDHFFYAVIDELVKLYDQTQESDSLTHIQSSMSCDTADSVSVDSVKRMCSIVVMSSFECCIGAERFDLAEYILRIAKSPLDVSPSLQALTNVLRGLYFDLFDDNLKSVLVSSMLKWEAMEIIPSKTTVTLQSTPPLLSGGDDCSSSSLSSTHGHRESLGKNSPADLRREVVEHDLSQLEFRLQVRQGSVSKEDFETLIHQCRKRKWCSEVHLVLAEMKRLSSTVSSLQPDASTCCVAIDAFVDASESTGALKLFKSIFSTSCIQFNNNEQEIVYDGGEPEPDEGGEEFDYDSDWCKYDRIDEGLGQACLAVCRGAAREGNPQLVYESASTWITLLKSNQFDHGSKEVSKITSDIIAGCMRALGTAPHLAFQLLSNYFKAASSLLQEAPTSTVFSTNHINQLVSLLMQSSAIVTRDEVAIRYIMNQCNSSQDSHEISTTAAAAIVDAATLVTNCMKKAMGCYSPLCVSALMSSASVAVNLTSIKGIGRGGEAMREALQFTLKHFISAPSYTTTTTMLPQGGGGDVKVLANLPMFPCILLEAFGRCPNSAFKSTVPKNKRKKETSESTISIGPPESLPFNSFVRPNLLSSIHKRVIWLRRVFELMFIIQPSKQQSLSTDQIESPHQSVCEETESAKMRARDTVEIEEGGGNDDDEGDDGVGDDDEDNDECSELSLEDKTKRLVYWEDYFKSVMTALWHPSSTPDESSSGETTTTVTEASTVTSSVHNNLREVDPYLLLVSLNELATSELGALLRLQRIYVRTLQTKDKQDRAKLQSDLEFIYQSQIDDTKSGDNNARMLISSLFHLSSTYLMLPDKMQGKLAKFICEAVKVVVIYQVPSFYSFEHTLPTLDRCSVLPLKQVIMDLKPCSIEVLKEVYKNLLLPLIDQSFSFTPPPAYSSTDTVDDEDAVDNHATRAGIAKPSLRSQVRELSHSQRIHCLECLDLLISHVLEMTSTREKIMKIVTFLKELRIQLSLCCQTFEAFHYDGYDAVSGGGEHDGVYRVNQDAIHRTVLLTLLKLGHQYSNSDMNEQQGKLSSTRHTPSLPSECLDSLIGFASNGLEEHLVLFLRQEGYLHVAAQLACKFSLTSNPIFLELVHESDRIHFSSLNQIKMNQSSHEEEATSCDNQETYLTLSMLGCQYHLVDDLNSVVEASRILRGNTVSDSASVRERKVLGIDAEWQPFSHRGGIVPVALLQISTYEHAFLFDLIKLEGVYESSLVSDARSSSLSSPSVQISSENMSEAPMRGNGDNNDDDDENDNIKTADDHFADGNDAERSVMSSDHFKRSRLTMVNETTRTYRDLILWLFTSKHIIKYGFGVKEDIRRLKESYPHVYQEMQVLSLIDLREDDVRFKTGSLSSAIEVVLGRRLDKRMQTSDWAVRPLTEQQMEYAALDARCVLELVVSSS